MSTLSGNGLELLRNYFDKNHLYRIGALTLPDRALVYTDHYLDYYTYELTPETASALQSVYGQVDAIAYPQTTSASDYMNHLRQGYSLVRLLVHSGGFGHYFGNQMDGKVRSEDIRALDPNGFFYVITSCGNFDYRQGDYIGGGYAFAESYGLLAIGDSGVHDLFVVLPEEFFPRLHDDYFGSAFLRYLQECVRQGARVDSIYSAIVIGDPLLKVLYNGPDSDSDGLSNQFEISIGTNPFNADTDGDGVSDYKELKLGTDPLKPPSGAEIVSLGVVPDSSGVDQGTRMTFTINVQNTGSKDMSSARVQLKILKPDGKLAKTLTITARNIQPGIEYNYTKNWRVPSTAPLGTYTYNVYLKYGATTLEQQEPAGTIQIT